MHLSVRLWPSLLALAAACGGSSPTSYSSNPPPPPPPPPPPAAPPAQTVSLTEFAFSPSSPSIKVGTAVQWVNNGTAVHNVTSDSPGVWSSTDVAPAQPDNSCQYPPCTGTTPPGTFSFTFNQAGTYAYHCSYHAALQNMKGTITVTP